MNPPKEMLNKLFKKFHYDDREMPLLEHLEAFRKAILVSVVALLVGMSIALPFADRLVSVLRAPLTPYLSHSTPGESEQMELRVPATAFSAPATSSWISVTATAVKPPQEPVNNPLKTGIKLQFADPSAALKMWLSVAFFGGFLLSLPVLVFAWGSFIFPGVRDVERRQLTRLALFSGLLFGVGIWMGYSVTLPMALGMMIRVGARLGGESIWFYSRYIGFCLQLLLGFGLAFQLPIVILLLGKAGLVTVAQLREKRRHVIVGLLVLAMVLTPPDVMTQLLMAAPLIVLYEFCIWVLYFGCLGRSRGFRGQVTTEEEKDEHD